MRSAACAAQESNQNQITQEDIKYYLVRGQNLYILGRPVVPGIHTHGVVASSE